MKNTNKKIENVCEIEPLVRERDAARFLGVSYETLKKTYRYGGLINYVKYKKAVRYRPIDLQNFINDHLIVVVTV